MHHARTNFSCKFNRLNINEGFNVKMQKKTVDVKMFNNSFKSICHLTQSNYLIQVRELWELMEQVSEKNMLFLILINVHSYVDCTVQVCYFGLTIF